MIRNDKYKTNVIEKLNRSKLVGGKKKKKTTSGLNKTNQVFGQV